MTPEEQAKQLAAWLETHPGAEPPTDLDPDVIEAVVALRPELAPAPRVTADEILGLVRSGPLVPGWVEGDDEADGEAAFDEEEEEDPDEAATQVMSFQSVADALAAERQATTADESDEASESEEASEPGAAATEAAPTGTAGSGEVIDLSKPRRSRPWWMATGAITGLAMAAAALLSLPFVLDGGSSYSPMSDEAAPSSGAVAARGAEEQSEPARAEAGADAPSSTSGPRGSTTIPELASATGERERATAKPRPAAAPSPVSQVVSDIAVADADEPETAGWGGEGSFASDNGYKRLSEDGAVALGREYDRGVVGGATAGTTTVTGSTSDKPADATEYDVVADLDEDLEGEEDEDPSRAVAFEPSSRDTREPDRSAVDRADAMIPELLSESIQSGSTGDVAVAARTPSEDPAYALDVPMVSSPKPSPDAAFPPPPDPKPTTVARAEPAPEAEPEPAVADLSIEEESAADDYGDLDDVETVSATERRGGINLSIPGSRKPSKERDERTKREGSGGAARSAPAAEDGGIAEVTDSPAMPEDDLVADVSKVTEDQSRRQATTVASLRELRSRAVPSDLALAALLARNAPAPEANESARSLAGAHRYREAGNTLLPTVTGAAAVGQANAAQAAHYYLQGGLDRAAASVAGQGLALSSEPTAERSWLLVLRADALIAQGDLEGARTSYEQAITGNEARGMH